MFLCFYATLDTLFFFFNSLLFLLLCSHFFPDVHNANTNFTFGDIVLPKIKNVRCKQNFTMKWLIKGQSASTAKDTCGSKTCLIACNFPVTEDYIRGCTSFSLCTHSYMTLYTEGYATVSRCFTYSSSYGQVLNCS